jgi:hypothetical protein
VTGNACTATLVAVHGGTAGATSLAARGWSSPVVIDAAHGSGVGIEAVACESASACVAVGGGGAADGPPYDVAYLGGAGAWTTSLQDEPAGISVLQAATCPSTDRCLAVGSDESVGGGLAVALEGSTWSIVGR